MPCALPAAQTASRTLRLPIESHVIREPQWPHRYGVTLTGAVASPELIGRAVQLALDTDGVQKVTSRLSIRGD